MKSGIIFTIIFFITFSSHAQNDDALTKTMLEQANDMGEKFVAANYKAFLQYTYPRTIEGMGGEAMALHKIETDMQSVKDEGITIINITFGAPTKIIKVGNDLQSTLPQIMVMRIPHGKVTSTTTMLAISNDNGKKWFFLDTVNYNHADMKMLIPNLSDQIIIPERADPSFEEDIKTE
ncbi:hypothetical protein ACX0HA_11890 [Flavobacterium hauense]